MSDCVFCRIVAGDLPAQRVLDEERVIAFRDLAPQAPVHVLVVPRDHHPDAAATAAADPPLLAEVLAAAARVAESEGLTGGYRLVANTGPDAGQTVFHLHVHVLGGRPLSRLG